MPNAVTLDMNTPSVQYLCSTLIYIVNKERCICYARYTRGCRISEKSEKNCK